MAQISKGDTFTNGEQVTGSRLNQLVDASTLLVGAITEQTSITANTLEATDQILVNDGGVLKKATIGDVLNSNINATFGSLNLTSISTSTINGATNKDIDVTPNDGVAVTGKTFTSVDGITAVVTSVAHGLVSNMLLDVTASNAAYTGQQVITVLSVDSFSFVIVQPTPVAASGTLDYTKKGSVKIIGNEHISNQLTVGGKAKVGGELTALGNIVSSGSNTFSGANDFTGSIKYNNKVVYGMYEKTVTHLTDKLWSTASPYNNVYTTNTKMIDGTWSAQTGSEMSTFYTETFTVPDNEQWEYDFYAYWRDDSDGNSLQGVAVYVNGTLTNAYRYSCISDTLQQFSTKVIVTAGVDRKIEIKVTKSIGGYIAWGNHSGAGGNYNIQPWYKVVTKYITA